MFQISKNIVFIDNIDDCLEDVMEIIDKYRRMNVEISFLLVSNLKKQGELFKNRFSTLDIIETVLLPLESEEVKTFMMKSVKNHGFSDKKERIDKLVANK